MKNQLFDHRRSCGFFSLLSLANLQKIKIEKGKENRTRAQTCVCIHYSYVCVYFLL